MALMPEYSETITKEEIELPPADSNKLAFLLHNILTKKECDDLIQESEKKGYEKALVDIGFGRELDRTDIKNSSRCVIDSFDYANILWERIKDFIPAEFEGSDVINLNERLQFLRYDPGEYFKPHFDGSHIRDNGERSLITFQVYLNEGFEGGETTFLDNDDSRYPVVPKTGTVLVFEHDILHEGSTLKNGRKYAVRTDVMYTGSSGNK